MRFFIILLFQVLALPAIAQPGVFKNAWTKAPTRIPSNISVDAPLMGKGDVTMTVGYGGNCLRYYLSKNHFWRLRSKAYGLSGPRVVGFVDIKMEGFTDAGFTAEQLLKNGITTCVL